MSNSVENDIKIKFSKIYITSGKIQQILKELSKNYIQSKISLLSNSVKVTLR